MRVSTVSPSASATTVTVLPFGSCTTPVDGLFGSGTTSSAVTVTLPRSFVTLVVSSGSTMVDESNDVPVPCGGKLKNGGSGVGAGYDTIRANHNVNSRKKKS